MDQTDPLELPSQDHGHQSATKKPTTYLAKAAKGLGAEMENVDLLGNFLLMSLIRDRGVAGFSFLLTM